LSSSIGIIDADLLDGGTRHPNLALMKISAYKKKHGAKVSLLTSYDNLDEFSEVFIGKVFSFSKFPKNVINMGNVTIGGTGFFSDGGADLSYEIEHCKPDYNLYDDYIFAQISKGKSRTFYKDYLDYSIGFATRGCFRKCDFCVNKKYSSVFKHSPISEFLEPSRKGIYLWDDNFFGFQGWQSVLDEIEATKKPFQFRQGLDIRLLNKAKAERFAKVKYIGDFIFAFDFIEDKKIIIDKLELWRKYNNRTTKLYILCAYQSTDEVDVANVFERIHVLMKYSCIPYIMRFESYKKSKFKGMYTQIARWCNQPQFYKKMSFRQFCEANQFYHKNPNTFCSAYKVMLDFEENYPMIAAKYFDLRYENEMF